MPVNSNFQNEKYIQGVRSKEPEGKPITAYREATGNCSGSICISGEPLPFLLETLESTNYKKLQLVLLNTGTPWLRVPNDLMSLPTSCLEQTAGPSAWGGVEEDKCAAKVGLRLSWVCLLDQTSLSLLHPAFFVAPAALAAAAMAHSVLYQAQDKASAVREISRKNSILKVCVAKNCSAVIWKGAKGPCPLGWKARGSTRHKGSLERRNIVFHWRFWVSHSPSVWLSTEHTTLPRTSPGSQQPLPRRKSPAGLQGTLRAQRGGLAKQLCQGARALWLTLTKQPSAWGSLADICLKPGLSRIYLRNLTAKCPDETGTSFCDG